MFNLIMRSLLGYPGIPYLARSTGHHGRRAELDNGRVRWWLIIAPFQFRDARPHRLIRTYMKKGSELLGRDTHGPGQL